MITISNDIVSLCRQYVQLMCAAREAKGDYATALRVTAMHLMGNAPWEAAQYLDDCKHVLEIDQEITYPDSVLLRASLLGPTIYATDPDDKEYE